MERNGLNYVGRVYGGRVPCFAFVRDWLADHGLHLPEYDYPADQHLEALRRHLAEHSDRVTDPAHGDVAVIRSDDPAHIGIMLGPDSLIHHTRTHGVVIERTRSFRLRGRIVGYFRPRMAEPV